MGDKPQIKGGTFKSVGHLKGMLDKKPALIQMVPADSTKVVRFLTEPDEWFAYQEYWDNDRRRYVPVAEGIEPAQRPSQRFLAQVVDRETDQVIPLKMAKDLANRLMIRHDRNGTMLDRDYEIMRSGKGLDTTYDVTPEAPTEFDGSKYTKIDLLKILEDAFESAMGNDNALFAKKEETVASTSSSDNADFVEDTDSVEDDEDFFEDIEVESEDETAENIAKEEGSAEKKSLEEEDEVAAPTDEEILEIIKHAEEYGDLKLKVLDDDEVYELFQELDDDSMEFDSVDDFKEWAWGDELWTETDLKDLSMSEIKEVMEDQELQIQGADKNVFVEQIMEFQKNFLHDCIEYAKKYKAVQISGVDLQTL